MLKETHLKTVTSTDGTTIAFRQVGNGSPLLMVHGTGADSSRWAAVMPQLAQHFSVYALDRRGHGSSGDSQMYAIQREYEDIAAVAAAIDGPVDVLGHSFGAACVLGAAPLIPNLRRFILYEPPMMQEQQTAQRDDQLNRMDQALAAGNREAVVLILLTEMLRVPLPAVDRLRAMPAWAGSLSAAHTIPRELRSSHLYATNPEAIKAIKSSTLFLLGSDSPDTFRVTTETLKTWIPNSQVAALPGQQHSAMLTAPDLFAAEVIRFANSVCAPA
jgi:pimeloyl-ACP methyl ester carboxylesterase